MGYNIIHHTYVAYIVVLDRTQKYRTSNLSNLSSSPNYWISPKIPNFEHSSAQIRTNICQTSAKPNFEPSKPWAFLSKPNIELPNYRTEPEYIRVSAITSLGSRRGGWFQIMLWQSIFHVTTTKQKLFLDMAYHIGKKIHYLKKINPRGWWVDVSN